MTKDGPIFDAEMSQLSKTGEITGGKSYLYRPIKYSMNLMTAGGNPQETGYRILIFILLIGYAHHSAFSHANNKNSSSQEQFFNQKLIGAVAQT